MISYLPNQKSDLITASPSSMLNKRLWKPSSLELAVLQMHFQKNSSPCKKDKEQLLVQLKTTFETDCSITQLGDWFQTERKNNFKRVKTDQIQNSSYVKFDTKDLKLLHESFESNNYPENEEMKSMADNLGVKPSKIENWYKHHRRSLAKKGEFDIKNKRYFNKNEVNYLMYGFRKNSKPSFEEILAIAKEINCTELQIKNWFSNKRKKLRDLDQTQKNEILNYSEHPQPQTSRSYEEANPYLSSDLSPTNPPLDLEASETSLLPDEPQRSIKRSYLPEENHRSQSASINFDSFSTSKRTPQELYPHLLQCPELRGGSLNFYAQNSFNPFTVHQKFDEEKLVFIPGISKVNQARIQTPFLNRKNNQTNYLVLIQNPIRQNFSNVFQNPSPALRFGRREILALPLINLQNSYANNQALLLHHLRTRNAFLQMQQSIQINQNPY